MLPAGVTSRAWHCLALFAAVMVALVLEPLVLMQRLGRHPCPRRSPE
jgi:hypothetical protein